MFVTRISHYIYSIQYYLQQVLQCATRGYGAVLYLGAW
jgi:hypothetical protein